MDPIIAHVTAHGRPLCNYYNLKGLLYYVYEGDRVVYCGLIKCQYDSHWEANNVATYLIERGNWPGVESEDGPCPSAKHTLPVVNCIWCRGSFKSILKFEMHQYVGCMQGNVDCLVCRRGFGNRAALISHALTHRSVEEKEEYRDRFKDKRTRVKYRLKPEDAFGQYVLGRPSYRIAKRCEQYDGETFSISPDLTTGERGLCTE